MDPTKIIEILGGGLESIVIVGLAIYSMLMTRRSFEVQDARIEDQKSSSKEMRELTTATNSALTSASQAMSSAVAGMTSAREAMQAATAVMERSAK